MKAGWLVCRFQGHQNRRSSIVWLWTILVMTCRLCHSDLNSSRNSIGPGLDLVFLGFRHFEDGLQHGIACRLGELVHIRRGQILGLDRRQN